jgi:hypothetical protein
MPTINKYKNKPGFYIKSVHDRKITTYQVTDVGGSFLISKGYGHKDEISVEFLMHMKRKGYVFTQGSGAGDIDLIFLGGSSRNSNRHKRYRKSNRQKSSEELAGCVVWAILIIVILILVSWII